MEHLPPKKGDLMNVLGIIAEYNPFHKGHAYQIETLRKETNADYVVIAMSGNFVQRGAPALMDKYSRTRMALSCGADLVLELPALYACASAEYFASGGVALLESTGVVTHLGFGTETEDFGFLQEIADILCQEPEAFRDALQQELKKGLSFPAARAQALKTCFMKQHPTYDKPEEILASPNNILALEYLKALSRRCSGIIPCPLLRRGQSYHDTAPGQTFSSASAIRARIAETNSLSENIIPDAESKAGCPHNPGRLELLRRRILPDLDTSMPKAASDILLAYPHPFLQENDFSLLLHYKLLTESSEQLSSYADSSPDLARRMKHESGAFLSWSSFCSHLKSKNFTYTRLSRVFLHAILNIYGEDYQTFPQPSYLRALGFRKEAVPLLSAIKAKGSLPFITSPASLWDGKSSSTSLEYLPPPHRFTASPTQRLFSLDLTASDLYRIGLTARGDNSLQNDFKQPLILL